MSSQRRVAELASTSLRMVAYLFLRWFPGPVAVPMTIFTLFAIYVPSFVSAFLAELRDDVGDGLVDVVLEKTTVPPKDDGPPRSDGESSLGEDTPVVAVQELDSDIDETVMVRRRSSQLLRTLLLGGPSPSSSILSMVTFLVNLCLVLMSADFLLSARLYYPSHHVSFARLGHVSPSEAKFIIREPDQLKMPVTLEIHIQDARPPFDNPLWQVGGGIRWTTVDTDYTAALTVPLAHSQQRIYEWRTSNNHSGEFTAPPKPGKADEYHGGKYTFLATSCIIPRFPYKPSDHPLSIPGLRHLAKVLPTLGAQFMLFMGDFIYIDVPQRFGASVEDYRQKYRQVYASPDWLPVSQNLSWVHMLDDHEISNDWSANTTGVYKTAVDPFHNYHGQANPPQARRAGTVSSREGASYYEFTQGPATFFMVDTRTYRSSNDAPPDEPGKTMLGKDQLDDLLYWLNRPEPKGVKWKIVASSVPFTKNWPVNLKDTWGGFLAERRIVLEAMWDAGTRGFGVVIVSGDRHEFAATKFPPPASSKWPETAAPWEFSASPLNQFAFPLPTYKQTDGEDVMIKYINRGNSKFGALTIDGTANGDQSSLLYRLFIDGEERWNTTILSPPVVEDDKSGSFWHRFIKS